MRLVAFLCGAAGAFGFGMAAFYMGRLSGLKMSDRAVVEPLRAELRRVQADRDTYRNWWCSSLPQNRISVPLRDPQEVPEWPKEIEVD